MRDNQAWGSKQRSWASVFFVGQSTQLVDSGKDDLGCEFCQRIAPQFRIVIMSVLRAITTTDVNLRWLRSSKAGTQ